MEISGEETGNERGRSKCGDWCEAAEHASYFPSKVSATRLLIVYASLVDKHNVQH